jgi:glycyl-tRNA synthetase (class II)
MELNQNYVPVVETSVGLDRMFLAFLLLIKEETLEDGSTRTVEITFSSGSN